MRKWKVMFEIYIDHNKKIFKELIVEGGTKKLASIRALSEISRCKEFDGFFKSIISIEEDFD